MSNFNQSNQSNVSRETIRTPSSYKVQAVKELAAARNCSLASALASLGNSNWDVAEAKACPVRSSANSANSDNRYQDESSKSSGISSSNCGQLFFAPAMPELKPAFVVDVDASIRNLLALFEASNATEMRGHANG